MGAPPPTLVPEGRTCGAVPEGRTCLATGFNPWSGIAIVFACSLLFAFHAAAQEEEGDYPCEGMLEKQVEELVKTLAQVPKYGSTYVLVYPDRLGEVESLDSPVLKELRIAVYEGSAAAAMAQKSGLTVVAYPFEAGKIVGDVLDGNVDAGIVWAPVAGLGVLEYDFDYELSLRTAGAPAPPPPALQSTALPAATPPACAGEIGGTLEGYGVVPAEKLVPLDIRELLHLPAPPRDLEAARQGAPLYAEHCAKCHGPEAVAATDALAPVDLLVSVRRFSYPGFLYIALNGRSQNGMPGFRGSLDRELVKKIYRYVRQRSDGEIAVSGAVEAPEPPPESD